MGGLIIETNQRQDPTQRANEQALTIDVFQALNGMGNQN